MSDGTALAFFQGSKTATVHRPSNGGGNGGGAQASAIAQTFAAGGGVGTLGAQAAALSTRHAQEVQSSILMAKLHPRNQMAAFDRIMQACERRTLAESAVYSYAKGGTAIEGPSIRLAEVLAQNWGNIEFGVMELDQTDDESVMMAYAWDLETLARASKTFVVRHEIRAYGKIKRLTDPREIYELGANMGARRLRACILSIIPGDIVEAAVAACNRTMERGETTPIKDRVRAMVQSFREFGVTVQDLEARLQHSLDSVTERELAGLRKVWSSMRDGFGTKIDYFRPPEGSSPYEQPAPVPAPSRDAKSATTHEPAAEAKPKPATRQTRSKNARRATTDAIDETPADIDRLDGILEILKYEKLDPALVAYVLRNMERPWLGKDQPIENLKPEMVDMISNNIAELRRKIAGLTADEIDIARCEYEDGDEIPMD